MKSPPGWLVRYTGTLSGQVSCAFIKFLVYNGRPHVCKVTVEPLYTGFHGNSNLYFAVLNRWSSLHSKTGCSGKEVATRDSFCCTTITLLASLRPPLFWFFGYISLPCIILNCSLVPGAVRREKRVPGVHCSRMRQVSMVACILLHYTKIMTNFSLPAERPHCRAMFLARNIWKDLKSEIISL